ncbi:MAG: HNH endonuclease [Bacillales bacterium]|jgi:hypothetical protein|nr:HNH endonuclease [Bacillales bacterium]
MINSIIELFDVKDKPQQYYYEKIKRLLEENNIQTPDELTPNTWEEMKFNTNYEINTSYPYKIRNKIKPHRFISESVSLQGYSVLSIGGKFVRKHQTIATQWLPNPNKYKDVDHINRDPTDNHIENIKWSSKSDNSKNRKKKGKITYEFIDVLPNNTEEINKVKDWEFEKLFYNPDVDTFYLKVNDMYRKLIILGGETSKHINGKDKNGQLRAISYNVFKKEYKQPTEL